MNGMCTIESRDFFSRIGGNNMVHSTRIIVSFLLFFITKGSSPSGPLKLRKNPSVLLSLINWLFPTLLFSQK